MNGIRTIRRERINPGQGQRQEPDHKGSFLAVLPGSKTKLFVSRLPVGKKPEISICPSASFTLNLPG